jgi:large subunit ribosomal protein L18
MKNVKQLAQQRRGRRVRQSIVGAEQTPRLAVHTTLKYTYAQVIDDEKSRTVAAASDVKLNSGNKTERAAKVGEAIAESAKKAGVSRVVFDRGAKHYHGRVKALAEAAREKGLRI